MVIVIRHDTKTGEINITTKPESAIVDLGKVLHDLSEYMQARVYASPRHVYVHSRLKEQLLIREPHVLFEAVRHLGSEQAIHVEFA